MINDQTNKQRAGTKRKNTKRTNNRLATDRSKDFKPDGLNLYKSEEYVDKLK